MRAQVPQLEARLARAGHDDMARRPATDLAYCSEGSIAGRVALARWHGGTWWHIRCRGHVRGGLEGGAPLQAWTAAGMEVQLQPVFLVESQILAQWAAALRICLRPYLGNF